MRPHLQARQPIGIKRLGKVYDLPIFGVLNGLAIVGVVGAAASVVVRFRRSRGVEGQQLTWFAYATVVFVAPLSSPPPSQRGSACGGWGRVGSYSASARLGVAAS
jgi:hypothetical protein